MKVTTYEEAMRGDIIAHTEQIHKLQEQNAELTAHLDKVEAERLGDGRTFRELITDNAELNTRLNNLTQAGVQTQRAWGKMIESLGELDYDQLANLVHRLDALEQTVKDQTRNSNTSAVAFTDRLDAYADIAARGRDVLVERIGKLEILASNYEVDPTQPTWSEQKRREED